VGFEGGKPKNNTELEAIDHFEKVSVPHRGVDTELLSQRSELFWIFTLQTLPPMGIARMIKHYFM